MIVMEIKDNSEKVSTLTEYQKKLLEDLKEASEGYELKKGDCIHVRSKSYRYEGFLVVCEFSEDKTIAYAKFKDGEKKFKFPSVYKEGFQPYPTNPYCNNLYHVLVKVSS